MIGTTAGLGGFGAGASKQSKLRVPTLGSLATGRSTANAAAGKENQDNDFNDSENQRTGSDPEDASHDAHVIDNSPSFARSSPSSTFHVNDTVASTATNNDHKSTPPDPLPTPSPSLAAALMGSAGQNVPPSPIRTLQDPWGRSNGNGNGNGNADEFEFADLSSIADLTRDDSIITAKSVLVGDLDDMIGEDYGNDNSSGGGIAGHQSTFASTTTPSKDENSYNDGDSRAKVSEKWTRSLRLEAAFRAEEALINSIANIDPTSALHEHYQAIGRTSQQPQYRDVQHRDSNGIATGWWRSILSCPMMEKDYCSALPYSILLPDSSGSNGRDDTAIGDTATCVAASSAWSNILTKLGEYKEFDDGYVYFKSKKGARKAAALCAYEANIVYSRGSAFRTSQDGSNDELNAQVNHIMYRSKSEAIGAIPLANTPSSDNLFEESPGKILTPAKAADTSGTGDAEPLLPSTTSTRRLGYSPRSYYPAWVERLCRLGVDPLSINIEFREKLSKAPTHQHPQYLSKSCPTKLCCVMKVSSPLKLTAVSLPFQSRSKALESASLLVEDEVHRQDIATKRHDLSGNGTKWEVKEGLIRSAPEKMATFVFSPPLCFTAPIKASDDTELFVYELDLATESGAPFVPTAMGLSLYATTRMAVVFGRDIFADSSNSNERQVDFIAEIPTRNGLDKVKVALRKKVALRLSPKDAKDKLLTIKRFNTVLCGWKLYGLVKWSRSRGSVNLKHNPEWPQHDDAQDNKRTVLFAPLRQKISTNQDEDLDAEIDWNLMRRVERFELQPYVVTVDSCGHPGVRKIRSCHMAIALALSAVIVNAYNATRIRNNDIILDECILDKLLNAPIACMWLAFHALAVLIISLLPPKRTLDADTLKNIDGIG